MARIGFLSFTCWYVLLQLQQVVAPPPAPVIEAYKPTTTPALTTKVQDTNSGFGSLNKLSKMLTELQHKIDDIEVQRRIMEAQMKSPPSFYPGRMEAGLLYTNTDQPSITYNNRKIVSANGVFLQIFPSGVANGTTDDTSPYTNMTINMVGIGLKNVQIQIMGTLTKKYLTCDVKGKFKAVADMSNSHFFLRSTPPRPSEKKRSWLLWNSLKYSNLKCSSYGWLLGFRDNNKLKKGKHSLARQLDSWFMIL